MAIERSALFDAPVLFIGFNRPDITQIVFSEIRKIKPKKLYFAVDGPRKNVEGDIEKCTKTRDIINSIDWDCELKTLFRAENLGCKVAVSSAIDWFFNNEEEGVILEDDCLPDQSFFLFCKELLAKYRNNDRIMMISGNNLQFGRKRDRYSYYFSNYGHIWGWASWRRAWKLYDVNMKLWPEVKSNKLLYNIFPEEKIASCWSRILDSVFKGEIDTWDHQLNLAIWAHNCLAIIPNENLVSNIGFGQEGTHAKDARYILNNLKTRNIKFPLKHPLHIASNRKADRFIEKIITRINPTIIDLIFIRLIYMTKLLTSFHLIQKRCAIIQEDILK